MKHYLIVLSFTTICMLASCKKQEVFITVAFPEQSEIDTIIHTVPISGTIFPLFADTLKVSEKGNFELKLNIKQPSFITIRDKSYSYRVKLLIEPGNNYYVSFGTQNNAQITGVNEKGQMLLTNLPDPSFIEQDLSRIGINIFNISDTISLSYIHNKINELKQSDLSKLKELLDDKDLSKSYFDLMQKDRDCYYASLEARFSILKASRQFESGMKIEDDLLENLKNIYDQYSPNDENLLLSSSWPEYARFYMETYSQYIREDFDIHTMRNLGKAGFNTYIITESKKYFSGKALEFFLAQYIGYTCFYAVSQSSFEKELISSFKQFERDYPQSEFLKYLKPDIEKIINYHRIIEQPFNHAILIMDNYETINTLEEAIKPLLGKKIYIDVWGTWCNPCIREFVHNEALKKYLVENDIQQLYIAVSDNDDLKWRNAIKYYHLTGTHIRANLELFRDLENRYSKNEDRTYIAVPWYILVDEKGNIIDERAKSPSQIAAGEKL